MIDGKKNKRQINSAQVTNIIKETLNKGKKVVVVVEQVNAMPGQGVTSMFNFGQSFGVIKGICAALSLPIYFVRPTKWKKHFNLIKTNKDASRTKIIEVYPEISSKLQRKKDSNRADAILIALYFNDTQV
jgi:crossover junction endodeoxyribonuclease RuvC